MTAHAAGCIPELARTRREPRAAGFPKHLVRVEEAFPVRLAAECQPVALVFPEIVGAGPSRLLALDPGEAWLRLVPDVLLTDPGATQAHLAALADLLRQVTCYRLESGPQIARSADLLAELL